ncbi:hypothetical protein MMC13_008087 [Lambiella insularis]|nr:hypothetical protein [Lambiella insularis]
MSWTQDCRQEASSSEDFRRTCADFLSTAELELERDLTARYSKHSLITRRRISTDSDDSWIQSVHPISELEVRSILAPSPQKIVFQSAENGKRMVGPAEQRAIPTVAQLESFFVKRNPGAANRMLFWSGVSENDAKNFATAHGKNTMEMLISNFFDEYTQYGRNKVFKTFADTLPFWKNAPEAAAKYAQGEVWVYVTPEGCKNGGSVWNTIEKPIIQSKRLRIVTYDDRGRRLANGC